MKGKRTLAVSTIVFISANSSLKPLFTRHCRNCWKFKEHGCRPYTEVTGGISLWHSTIWCDESSNRKKYSGNRGWADLILLWSGRAGREAACLGVGIWAGPWGVNRVLLGGDMVWPWRVTAGRETIRIHSREQGDMGWASSAWAQWLWGKTGGSRYKNISVKSRIWVPPARGQHAYICEPEFAGPVSDCTCAFGWCVSLLLEPRGSRCLGWSIASGAHIGIVYWWSLLTAKSSLILCQTDRSQAFVGALVAFLLKLKNSGCARNPSGREILGIIYWSRTWKVYKDCVTGSRRPYQKTASEQRWTFI